MGYHPETLAFSFPPYPRGGMSLRKHPQPWSLGRALYALEPWIGFDIWHIDPEKSGTGNRTDDSCGWFDRTPGIYADAVAYLLADQAFMHDVKGVLDRRDLTQAPFYEGISERPLHYHRLSAADSLAVTLMVATELELRRWWNGQDGHPGAHSSLRARIFYPKRSVTGEAISLALCTTDNLSSVDQPASMVRLVAAALNRRRRPWWRHPRWHVHHWQVKVALFRNLKRMVQPCATCGRPLGFAYCPTNDGSGKLHHGECLGHRVGSAEARPA